MSANPTAAGARIDPDSQRRLTAIGAALLVAALSALFYYKWGGSLRALRRVAMTGALGVSPDKLLHGGVLATTGAYFGRIWPALVYGIVIGAVVRSTVSPRWVAALLGKDGAKPTIAGAVCGSPLMLCSCCITPVFTGVYERGARLGPALALMLASPGLNVAALVLTFLLLPLPFGIVRVMAAAAIVLALAPLVGQHFESKTRTHLAHVDLGDAPATLGSIALHFARSLAYITVATVPLIVVGVALSVALLPHVVHLSMGATIATIAVVALAATLVALPTFFEIPLAILLVQLGAPAGAAVALLVAGPIVNLPSLFVLARETNVRVATSLALGVWVVAFVAGGATSLLA
jgi:uncharacterized membrane protein YraQ (UPF0718 family)